MPTHTIKTTYQGGSGNPLSNSEEATAGMEVNLEETIAAEASDAEIGLALDVSEIASLLIHCDRDLTIETNDGTTPDDTIAVKADAPIIWTPNSPMACPLTEDVTSIFVTLAAGANATLTIKALVDPTP